MMFIIEELNSYTFEIPDYTFDKVLYFSDKVISAKAFLCTEGMSMIIMVKDSLNNRVEHAYALVSGENIVDKKIQLSWLERKNNLQSYTVILDELKKENEKSISMMLN